MLLPARTSQRLLTPPAQTTVFHPCLWALTSMCKIQEAKLWDHRGVTVAIGRHRDCLICMRSGCVFWRNRRFLRPLIPLICSSVLPRLLAPRARLVKLMVRAAAQEPATHRRVSTSLTLPDNCTFDIVCVYVFLDPFFFNDCALCGRFACLCVAKSVIETYLEGA